LLFYFKQKVKPAHITN